LICMIVRKMTKFDPGEVQIRTLGGIVTYAMILNVFFFFLELFTAFYSQIPGHMHPFVYLFAGLDGHSKLVPWMWAAAFFGIVSVLMLVVPAVRQNLRSLTVACACVVIATWIDKGFGLVIGGFIPNPFERVFEYWPTIPEIVISMGVWATGFLVLTVLYKIAVSVKEELAGIKS
jgi:Ni/Fe-hydrogenase subunit HybB-like protein